MGRIGPDGQSLRPDKHTELAMAILGSVKMFRILQRSHIVPPNQLRAYRKGKH